MNRFSISLFAIILMFTCFLQGEDKAAAVGKRLLLDSRIIDSTDNVELKIGTVKKYGKPLFGEDRPWEARLDNMEANVMYDEQEKIYKLWYHMFIYDAKGKPPIEERENVPYRPRGREDGIAYATSKDGIVWEKPELGIIEFEGSKKNNLVGRGEHGAGVFKDMREKDPKKRYKMVFYRRKTMYCKFSADGIHFGEEQVMYKFNGRHGDTHNHALWVPELGEYALITRLWTDGRAAGHSTSKNFTNWTQPVEIMRKGAAPPNGQIYTLPTFRYAGLYLAMPVVYFDDLPYPELAWSPNTKDWHRIEEGTPFIQRAKKKYSMDWGCIYPAVSPIVMPDKSIRIYYLASNGYHKKWRDGFFTFATLRPDGWAGYTSKDAAKPAKITTKQMSCDTGNLTVTLDAPDTDDVMTVVLLDENGKKLAQSNPIQGDITDEKVSWKNDPKLQKDQEYSLQFILNGKAKLYSFTF